jgi:hypothetical protein
MTTTTIFSVPSVEAGIHQLAVTHPDWWANYEDSNLHPGTPDGVLLTLLESAPTDFAVGLMTGRVLAAPRLFD